MNMKGLLLKSRGWCGIMIGEVSAVCRCGQENGMRKGSGKGSRKWSRRRMRKGKWREERNFRGGAGGKGTVEYIVGEGADILRV